MGSRGKTKAHVIEIHDRKHWLEVLEQSDKKLIVVDLHKDWCGSCIVMHPTYDHLQLEYEAVCERLVFATVCDDLHLDNLPKLLGCKPLFLFLKNKHQVTKLEGANPSQFLKIVHRLIPKFPSD